MAYYNTTGLPDTAVTAFNNNRDGTSGATNMIPISQDLLGATPGQTEYTGNSNTTATVVGQKMATFSPYVPFTQGNIQGSSSTTPVTVLDQET